MVNKLKLICIVFILSIYPSQTIIGLEYHKDADFSDIFKGYEKFDHAPKLIDPLSADDLREISELIRLNQMTFDQIRKFNICEKDDEYISIPNSGQIIASAFLKKVCFLFYYNVEGRGQFFIFDSLGQFSKLTDVDEKNKFLQDKGVVPSYSPGDTSEAKDDDARKWISVVDTAKNYEDKKINNEQKYFILSIRQAILKIASNPVGRRLFCRILNKINDKKILIVQTRYDNKDGVFSFNKELTEALACDYICVTVPWKLGESKEERPGAGAVRTKTHKQLSVCVDGEVTDDMKIIGKSSEEKGDGSDEKPFYISLCHEFIHCLHYLEGTIVDLKEDIANKTVFSTLYKDCFCGEISLSPNWESFNAKLKDGNFYIRDYANIEEVYTVIGLKYETASSDFVFVIDNVSELSFNALEANKVIRLSYDSSFDARLLFDPDGIMASITARLKEFTQKGQLAIKAKTLLSKLTCFYNCGTLKNGEMLDEAIRKKLGCDVCCDRKKSSEEEVAKPISDTGFDDGCPLFSSSFPFVDAVDEEKQ